MNNFFITEPPFAKPSQTRFANYINWMIKQLGYGYKLERLPDGMINMNSVAAYELLSLTGLYYYK